MPEHYRRRSKRNSSNDSEACPCRNPRSAKWNSSIRLDCADGMECSGCLHQEPGRGEGRRLQDQQSSCNELQYAGQEANDADRTTTAPVYIARLSRKDSLSHVIL